MKRMFNATNLINTTMGDSDFMYMVADAAAMLVQYGNKAKLCGSFGDQKLIDSFAQLVSRQYGPNFGSGCFYDTECIRDKVKDDEKGVGARSWRWQKCSEVGFLQAVPHSGPLSYPMRSKRLSLEVLLAQCERMFPPPLITKGQLRARTDKINSRWGGGNPTGSRIFYNNYSDDPWWRASVVKQQPREKDLPVCMTTCNGCGHCGAGVPPNTTSLHECTRKADAKLAEWLSIAKQERQMI